MKSTAFATLVLIALCAVACRSVPPGSPVPMTAIPAAGDIVDGGAKERVPFETMVYRIREDRAVYVGESHNNDHHHAFQFEVVKALYEEDPRLLIGMEMFQRPYQEAIDRFLAGKTDEAQFLRETEYFVRWRWDWRYYRPIVLFAKEHGLPVVALNSPREANRRVSRGGGLKGLTPEDKKWVAEEVDLNIAAHREFVMKVFEGHPMGPGFDKEAFYASQCLWEDTMAESVARALDRHPGHRMVIIVGSGHVRSRFGIPVRAERRGATPYSIVLGMTPAAENPPEYGELINGDHADYFFTTADAPEKPPSPLLGFKPRAGDPSMGLVVDAVTEGTIAARAGMMPDDKILEVNGTPVPSLAELRIVLALLDDQAGVIKVLRKGKVTSLPYVLDSATQ